MNGLERLYYANGQRLAAPELRLEQRYHITVRRLLNRGLFTAGVVDGLEVVKASSRSVLVSPGLALDPLGRELVVDEPTTVPVPNQPPTNQTLPGYYLTVRYDEQQVSGDGDACAPGVIPTVVREVPLLEWTEDWPDHTRADQPGHERDAAIVIALATLSPACEIGEVQTGFRQYAHPTHTTQVSAVSFEGEKDVDADNPKTLHFEVSGGPPTSVVLALWGEKLSSLFYTELGRHRHETASVSLESKSVQLADHAHSLADHTHRTTNTLKTQNQDTDHRHTIRTSPYSHIEILGVHSYGPGPEIAVGAVNSPAYQLHGWHVTNGSAIDPYLGVQSASHAHDFSVTLGHAVDDNGTANLTATGGTTSQPSASHTHQLTTPAQTNEVGQSGYAVRAGAAHTYPEDVQVSLDGVDITETLKEFLGWQHLGTGGADSQLNGDGGTGPVDLVLDLGLSLEEGWHRLDFGVPSGGGKLLYNLYVR